MSGEAIVAFAEQERNVTAESPHERIVLDTGTFAGERVGLVARRSAVGPVLAVEGLSRSLGGASGISSKPPRSDESVTMSLTPQGGIVWGDVSDRVVRAELRTVQGATFPATVLPLPKQLGATGLKAVWGFVEGPTEDRVTTLVYDAEGSVLNRSYPTGPRETIGTGEDPAGGPWRVYLSNLNIGTGLGVALGAGGGGECCCLRPLGDSDLVLSGVGPGMRIPSYIAGLASPRVSRVALTTKDGVAFEGKLCPMPERHIGPAQAVLVLVPRGVPVEGNMFAFDSRGEELAHRAVERHPFDPAR